jgi:hypothetical protein
MNPAEAVDRIKKQILEIKSLDSKPRNSPDFLKWLRETKRLLQRIFGQEAYQVSDFERISFVYRGAHVIGDQAPFERRYRSALKEAAAILTSIYEEIETFGLESPSSLERNPLLIIENICSRFHSVARQLRTRHDSRPTLEVSDEYDVQDLLHSLLRLNFKDIRPEEWTPSYAGTSSRLDFLLKDEGIVVEVKMTRRTLKEKETANQLIIDIARYRSHAECKLLVCFVYDPDGWIGNPAALKKDVEASAGNFPAKVFVYPETR